MAEIYIPIDINSDSALIFSQQLSKIDLNREKVVSINVRNFAKNNGRIEPFAALFVINSYKSFLKKASQKGLKVNILYTREKQIVNTYAKSLRFYSSLGLPFGTNPDEDYRGYSKSSFIPIMKVDISSLKKSVDEYTEIKNISKQISTVVARGSEDLYKYINYCVIELLRNIVEHSETKHIWYAAQYWSKENAVEISIMDEGVGLQNSLKEVLEDEEEILKIALFPGCSSKPTTHYIGDNADNSGFGLFMISHMGKENGKFVIASNHEILMLDHSSEIYDKKSGAEGTIIRLKLDIDTLKDYELNKEELIKKGLMLTKKYLRYQETKKYAPGLPLPKLFE